MGCAGSKGDDGRKNKPGQRSAQYGQEEDETPNEPVTPKIPSEPVTKAPSVDYSAMIADLATVNIIQLASVTVPKGRKGRMVCAGSMTTGKQEDYEEKPVQTIGQEAVLAQRRASGLGFACKKGLKPESPNQDSWMVLDVENDFGMYGVFDGHGQKGHDSSHFVKEYLPKLIFSDPRFRGDEMPALFEDAFVQCQGMVVTADKEKKIKAQLSGTTVTVVVHDEANSLLTFAHCSDSCAVLGAWTDSTRKELKVAHETRTHKPSVKEERDRIEKAGGRVEHDGFSNYRIYAGKKQYPGLNMSRAMGDIKGHNECGLSAKPEVTQMTIAPEHHVLLVCSDGIWEFITPQQAIDFVGKQPPEKAQETVEALTKMAWERWIEEEKGQVVDDITAILVYLNTDGPPAETAIGA